MTSSGHSAETVRTHRRGPLKALWYWLTSTSIWIVAKTLYGLRVHGARRVPSRGPVVLVANHASHLDPPLVGGTSHRQLSFMARDTLFVGPLGWLIRSYEAIPIDRDGAGLAGVRATLKRLKQGGAVLVFPEGTRSADGELQPLRPGFVALVRRGKAALLPLAIAGAYEVWPRGSKRPRLTGRIGVAFGEPIDPEALAALSDDEIVELARRGVEGCLNEADRLIRR